MQNLRERVGMALVGDQVEALLAEVERTAHDNIEMLTERLAELELAREDVGWLRLIGDTETEFSRSQLADLVKLARLYWLKNPLIKRAVETQTNYVFGQGVNIEARHPLVNQVVQDFLDDPKNRTELTSHQARMIKETELQNFGNLFFVFFANASNGATRVRTIPMPEVQEIICNPEDSKDPWYYKRIWQQQEFAVDSGRTTTKTMTAYYPDWRYRPSRNGRPNAIGGSPVQWDMPVYHVKVNCLSDMKFGVPELYAAFDWAKAYKGFLENWASLMRAYARLAWAMQVKGGAAGVAAAQARLATTLNAGNETNPPPVTGATVIGTEGFRMEPIRTAGATTSADGGRRLALMVSSVSGVFEHYLMGDPSTGNLATAKTMNRPMELMFRARQTLWRDSLQAMLQFVVDQSAKAPKGLLPGHEEENAYGEMVIVLGDDEENEDPELAAEPTDRHIEVTFPPILEPDIAGRVDAIVKATTLGSMGIPAGTFPDLRFVAKLLLQALGEEDIDELLAALFPEGDERDDEAEAKFAEALVDIKDVLVKIAEGEE
ncbi:MAG: hypothetical protein V3V32_04385 [Dehalococcoidia bacterium]